MFRAFEISTQCKFLNDTFAPEFAMRNVSTSTPSYFVRFCSVLHDTFDGVIHVVFTPTSDVFQSNVKKSCMHWVSKFWRANNTSLQKYVLKNIY